MFLRLFAELNLPFYLLGQLIALARKYLRDQLLDVAALCVGAHLNSVQWGALLYGVPFVHRNGRDPPRRGCGNYDQSRARQHDATEVYPARVTAEYQQSNQ